MSQIANIVIADGAGTPVSHTFEPISSALPAIWRESIDGVPLYGEPEISLNLIRGSSMNTVRAKLMLPVMETITGTTGDGYSAAPKVAYSVQASAEFKLPARSTITERKDLRVLLRNLLADAVMVDAVDSVKPVY